MAWPCRLGQCRAHGGGCHVRVALTLSDVVDVCCILYASYNYHQKQARTQKSIKVTAEIVRGGSEKTDYRHHATTGCV
jgi:hypothetical protein